VAFLLGCFLFTMPMGLGCFFAFFSANSDRSAWSVIYNRAVLAYPPFFVAFNFASAPISPTPRQALLISNIFLVRQVRLFVSLPAVFICCSGLSDHYVYLFPQPCCSLRLFDWCFFLSRFHEPQICRGICWPQLHAFTFFPRSSPLPSLRVNSGI